MERGAVVMMDALGFKGIWKRNDEGSLLEELKSIRSAAEAAADEIVGGAEQRRGLATDDTNVLSRVTIEFLSDTIVICVAPKSDPKVIEPLGSEMAAFGLSAFIAGMLASRVMQLAAQSPLGLAYRGTLAIGNCHVEPSLILGGAIDDAAEHMDQAEGAFVWMLPTAVTTFREHLWALPQHPLIQYPVPLKGGSVIETLVVPPFGPKTSEEHRQEVVDGIDRSFRAANSSLGVEIKRQNTMRFIDHCRARIPAPPP